MGVSKTFKVLFFLTLCIFATISAAVDTLNRSAKPPTISASAPNQIALERSTQSSVRVISTLFSEEQSGVTSTSSGTYLEHKGETYILTTAHSIIGYCEDIFVIALELMYHCEEFIMINQDDDIAVLKIDKIEDRVPVSISKNIYPMEKVYKSLLIHDKFIYTGYPQGIGPFTFNGTVVSQPEERGYVFAHSYAWSGSSGSGVFDTKGNLVGLITAVSVANSEYGIDVMEDLVIVTPVSLLDLQVVF